MKAINIARICICAILLGIIINSVHSQSTTNGLIGFYPFNGNANDESGNLYHGTPVNVLSVSDRFGSSGKAYSFDGADDFILIPNSFDVLPRTIDLWFNSANVDYSYSYGAIYQSDNPALMYGNTGMAVLQIEGQKKLLLTIAGVSDTVDINPNTWYNAAMVVNQNQEIFYYLNGSLLKVKSFSDYITSYNGLSSTVIGENRILSDNLFTGIIDDIRIYNRVLVQREIEQIFNEGACANIISVMDTLIIDVNLISSDPLVYQNSIKIYPNPTHDYLNIDCGMNYHLMSTNRMKITNSLGHVMFENAINQQFFQLDLSAWSGNGLYLLYISDSQNNIIEVKKILLR